jgi:hypothetical protein
MSEGVIVSAQGLFEGSSDTILLPARLSLRLSLMLFGSPLTALFLANPEELEPEFDSAPAAVLELILDVSMVSPRFGDLPLPAIFSSTQPAGVGGTGPKVDIRGGLLVGGDVIRSDERVMLWDLDCGGGPGGGGGNGMPGSHLVVEEFLEREDVGVLIAPVDTARREAGGLDSTCSASFSLG